MKNGPVVADRAVLPERIEGYCSATSTRRASALLPLPVMASDFFTSILSSAMPAVLSAALTASARCLASSSFFAGSPVASV